MSKKKRKTRKQKEKAIINRQKYLSVMNQPETSLTERQVGLTKETPKAIQAVQDTKAVTEDKFIISNIKRTVVYIGIFFIFILGLYFLELQGHYMSSLSSSIMSILTK
jgi:hypothetical protein